METGFIARDRELAELLAGLEDALAGRGGIVLIAGEPGIGKTTLADQLGRHAENRGARVLWGRSWEGAGAAPYWLWSQVVQALAERIDEEARRSLFAPDLAHMTALGPDVAAQFGDAARSLRVLESDAGRFYFFEATARFLRRASALHPLVIVLDDLLTGDRASLLLLRFLAREVRSAPLLILATYREAEATRSPDGVELIADLVRESRLLTLRGLDRDEVARLIAQFSGVVPPRATTAAIHEATGGNPLFVREVTRLLATRDPVAREGQLSIPIPDGVRAVIYQRLASLPALAVQVLAAAAVVGRDFEIPLVGAASALPLETVLTALSDARALGAVTEVADTAVGYRFSHPLMREVVYEGLPIAARAQMHQRVGDAIERVHGAQSAAHLGELAYHFARSAAIGDSTKAGDYARRAGDRAMGAFAYEEAVVQYRRALDALALAGGTDRAGRCELLLCLGRAQARAGEYQDAKATCLHAVEMARELGDAERLARAALGFGEPQVEGGLVDRQLVTLLEEAMAALAPEDGALRARVLARLSLELTFADDAALREMRRDSLSLEAIQMARRLGDVVALCNALRARWLARWGPDGFEERSALSEEHMALARATGDREIELLARARRITCLLEAGDGSAATDDIAAHARLAEELRMPYHEWASTTMRAARALLTGAFDHGETLAEAGLVCLRGRPNASHAHGNLITLLRWEQGRLGELRSAWHDSVERFPQLRFARGWLCLAELELGRHDAAREHLAGLVALLPDLPRDGLWLTALALGSLAAVRLEDAEAARRLHALLLPFATRTILIPMPHPAVCFGAASFYLGVLAATMGAWDEAGRHFDEALGTNQRLGARPFLARTQVEYARMLVHRGRGGDRRRALELLEAATATARTMAWTPMIDTISAIERDAAAQTGTTDSCATQGSNGGSASILRREGEYWTFVFEGSVIRLRDSKGLRCLARLLASPGQAILAIDIESSAGEEASPMTAVQQSSSVELRIRADLGDAGELLDASAKAAYKARLDELRDEIAEAERFQDPTRAATARDEMEFVVSELARAVGLGGRDRKAASHAERARLNVTRAIRAALRTIVRTHPSLGEHLARTVRTGRYCSYVPDPRVPMIWDA